MPIEPTLSEYRYDVESFYYLSDDILIPQAIEDTDLSLLELEEIVGRFAKHSCRAGQLRGKIVIYLTGKVQIRHHFTNKLLWENN